MTRPTSTLTIPRAIHDAIIAHAREGKPEEICGLLRGRDGAAHALIRAKNVAKDKINNYDVDPKSLLLQFEFEEAGDEMVAIYHSHPISVAYPSATDAWSAHYPESAYVICSLEFDDTPVLRAFALVADYPDWPIEEIRQTLPFYETRPGLWGYFHKADAPLPEALAPFAPEGGQDFYVVFAVNEDDEGKDDKIVDSRLVPVEEIAIQIAPL